MQIFEILFLYLFGKKILIAELKLNFTIFVIKQIKQKFKLKKYLFDIKFVPKLYANKNESSKLLLFLVMAVTYT